MTALGEILREATGPLGGTAPSRPLIKGVAKTDAESVLQLLERMNGFFAFDAALHVFPQGASHSGFTLEEWNAPEL